MSERCRPSAIRTPMFRWIFSAVLGLTILSLAVSIALSLQPGPMSPQQASLFEACSTTWKLGFGAIVGLLGGRATVIADGKVTQ